MVSKHCSTLGILLETQKQERLLLANYLHRDSLTLHLYGKTINILYNWLPSYIFISFYFAMIRFWYNNVFVLHLIHLWCYQYPYVKIWLFYVILHLFLIVVLLQSCSMFSIVFWCQRICLPIFCHVTKVSIVCTLGYLWWWIWNHKIAKNVSILLWVCCILSLIKMLVFYYGYAAFWVW